MIILIYVIVSQKKLKKRVDEPVIRFDRKPIPLPISIWEDIGNAIKKKEDAFADLKKAEMETGHLPYCHDKKDTGIPISVFSISFGRCARPVTGDHRPGKNCDDVIEEGCDSSIANEFWHPSHNKPQHIIISPKDENQQIIVDQVIELDNNDLKIVVDIPKESGKTFRWLENRPEKSTEDLANIINSIEGMRKKGQCSDEEADNLIVKYIRDENETDTYRRKARKEKNAPDKAKILRDVENMAVELQKKTVTKNDKVIVVSKKQRYNNDITKRACEHLIERGYTIIEK